MALLTVELSLRFLVQRMDNHIDDVRILVIDVAVVLGKLRALARPRGITLLTALDGDGAV